MSPATIRHLAYVGGVALFAGVYYVTAKFGLRVTELHPSVTTIWAPTGISFVVLLLAGIRYWPGVFIGAFAANLTTFGTVITSWLIACGNTLEAVVITYLVITFAFGVRVFDRLQTVGTFIVAALAGGAISSSVGVGSLLIFDFADPHLATTIWTTWFLGNLGGAIVIAPLALAWWNNNRMTWSKRQFLEIGAVLSGVLLTAYVIFGPPSFPFDFLVAPVLVWAIMRFSMREAMSAFALLSACAVLGTMVGNGPFAAHPPALSLLYLQTFFVVVGMCILALSATVAERRSIETSLKNADRAKDQFLSMLSHELRNPLTTIVSYAQLLTYGKRTADERLMLDNMQKEIEHITHLLEDLLDLSRIRRGRIELKRDLVNVEKVARDAGESAHSIMHERGLAFSVESESSLYTWGDATRIKQMIVNLLTNSAKYTDEGSITLSAHAEKESIVVRVKDTGIGISPARLPFLFDESRAHGALSKRHSRAGLGIGLSLVNRLAALHGGTLSAESEGEGKGSVFTIRLPRAAAVSIAPAETLTLPDMEKVPPARPAAMLSIFVVDDNILSADALAQLLHTYGYPTEALYSGRALLKRLTMRVPDVILLDIDLGDMSGYTVAEKMHALHLNPQPILIALSGYGSDDDIERSRGEGFAHYLVKPVNITHVREILARL